MFCFACEQAAACRIGGDGQGLCGMSAERVQAQNALLGTLIGLARATEGNEYLLTDSTPETVVEGLAALNGETAEMQKLRERAEAEKRNLVPSCYICAAPCGRTDNYCMDNLRDAHEDIRSIKSLILSCACAIAHRAAALAYRDDAVHQLLYKALFAIGRDDWETEELLPIMAEMEEVKRRHIPTEAD